MDADNMQGDRVVRHCTEWSECDVTGGGCCRIGLFGGKPSLGTCMNACRQRKPVQGDEAVDEPAPAPVPRSMLSKAISYIKAEVSAVTSTITDDEVAARLDACRSCSSLTPSKEQGQVGWCNSCGCGQGRRAELTVKSRMPAATCPLNRWPR